MHITAALYRAAHGFEPGMAKLAEFLGISEHSLQHKVSPTYPGAHCSPEELVRICDVTGDLGPAHAIAARLGQLLIPMPVVGGVDGDVAVKLAAACKSFGELITEYSSDLADGRVSQNELRRIERECSELQADLHALMAHAASLAAAPAMPASSAPAPTRLRAAR